MRALAHPMRLRILGHLRLHGPATSSTLAREFGMNSGATSYHLRHLANHGLIEEDAERGSKRERWWQAPHQSTYFDQESLSGESGEHFLRALSQVHVEHIHHAAERHVTMTTESQGLLDLSDWMLNLTPEEATSLGKEIAELLGRYRRHTADTAASASDEAHPILVQLQILPHPQSNNQA